MEPPRVWVRDHGSERKQDSMLSTLRGWDTQVLGGSAGGATRPERGGTHYTPPNLLLLWYTNFIKYNVARFRRIKKVAEKKTQTINNAK